MCLVYCMALKELYTFFFFVYGFLSQNISQLRSYSVTSFLCEMESRKKPNLKRERKKQVSNSN